MEPHQQNNVGLSREANHWTLGWICGVEKGSLAFLPSSELIPRIMKGYWYVGSGVTSEVVVLVLVLVLDCSID